MGGFRPCKHTPFCPELAPPGKRYCPEHEGEEREAVLLYDRERNKFDPIRKLHNSRRWRKGTAQTVLRRDILCQDCKREPATEADHIENAREIVRKYGVEEFFNPARCQGLCTSCHSRKTAREVGYAGKH